MSTSTDTELDLNLPEAASPGSLHTALIDTLNQWRLKYCGRNEAGDLCTNPNYETEAAALLAAVIVGVAYADHGLSCATTAVMSLANDIMDNVLAARPESTPCPHAEADGDDGSDEDEDDEQGQFDLLEGAPSRDRFN